MNLSKDAYEYLMNFADDRTILNMLMVNKKFFSEDFFERVMRRKYPLLVEFKKKDDAWKKHFVKMVYGISKLEENYGIPYVEMKGYNPLEFYIENKDEKRWPKRIYDYMMMRAAKGGKLEMVKLMLKKGASELNTTMREAAEGGHLEIVKYMIKHGAHKLDEAMAGAPRGGQ